MATYVSPTGNPEVWAEKPAGYFSPEEWAAAHPAPEPDPAAEAARAQAAALAEAGQIIMPRLQRQAAQAEAFSPAELSTLARAGLFEEWAPGREYAAGQRIAHEGRAYEVQMSLTAQAHQAPDAEGMLAVYRPISADPDSGEEPQGGPDSPIPFILGLDVLAGKYYSHEGLIYLAKADMIPCVWPPDSPGLWQWEAANG